LPQSVARFVHQWILGQLFFHLGAFFRRHLFELRLEFFPFFAHCFGLFDLSLQDDRGNRRERSLHRTRAEHDDRSDPTKPCPREHQELRIAETHACATANQGVDHDKR